MKMIKYPLEPDIQADQSVNGKKTPEIDCMICFCRVAKSEILLLCQYDQLFRLIVYGFELFPEKGSSGKKVVPGAAITWS